MPSQDSEFDLKTQTNRLANKRYDVMSMADGIYQKSQ